MKEVVLYAVALIAQANDKISMSVVGVVLHKVPEDRARPDRNHGLGHVVDVAPESHSRSSTKKHDFHDLPPLNQLQ